MKIRLFSLALLYTLALLVTGGQARAQVTPVRIQSRGLYFGSVTSGPLTLNGSSYSGDALYALVYYNSTSSISVSDPKNGVYAQCPSTAGVTWPQSGLSNGFQFANCFYANNITGSSAPPIITLNLGSASFSEMEVVEVSLQDSVAPTDKTAFATATSGSASSGPVTTTGPDLVIGFFQGSGNPSWTATGGFVATDTLNSTSAMASNFSQSAPGVISATATASSNTWGAILVAVKGTTATLSSVSVTPNPAGVTIPSQIQMTAIGAYSDSTNRNVTPLATWGSSNTGIATISTSGVATPIAPGTTTITATLGSSNGSSALTISAQTHDIYGGLLAAPCTNTNTSFKVGTITAGDGAQHILFCDVLGNAMFARGFYTMDPTGGTNNELGKNYQTYEVAKYGLFATAVNAIVQEAQAMGMNAIPAFSNAGQRATSSPPPPVLLPFVGLMLTSEYVLVDRLSWGTGPAKDLSFYLGRSAPSNWGDSLFPMADLRDPNFAGMFNGILANDSGFSALGTASATTRHWLLGVSPDESDGTHCFGAGPDFATQPAGVNDYRCGYVSLFIPPVSYANPLQQEMYPDGTVYMKKRMHDLLITAHGGFSGLNSSWGSSYTTMDSSGVCVGAPPVTCASSVAADVVGSGNGSSLTFGPVTLTHTIVSKYSLGIFVNGVLVGGDNGSGAIYGMTQTGDTHTTTLGGTINYATGALSLTFVSGHAPASGTNNITAAYVANGFGIGTGFMDEDCRSSHASYCGSGSANTTIYLCATPPSTGCLSPAVQADINAMTQDWAHSYATTVRTNLDAWSSAHGFTGSIPNLGPTTLGTWSTPPDRYILQGLCGQQDVMMYGGQGIFSQAENDFVNTSCPGMGIIPGSYRTANADSSLAWPNLSCTHSGTTVTCTGAANVNFTTSTGIQASCSNSDYAPTGIFDPSSVSGSTVSYTVSPAPLEASSTCNLFWTDSNVGGFATQTARANDYQTKNSALPLVSWTSGGVRPIAGLFVWAWQDSQTEHLNWGVKSTKDNAYGGINGINEAVDPVVTCSILTSYNCGGEDRGPYGNAYETAIILTNTAIDCELSGTCSGGKAGSCHETQTTTPTVAVNASHLQTLTENQVANATVVAKRPGQSSICHSVP